MLKKIKKLLPMILLAMGLILFFSLNGQRYLSLQVLSQHYQNLQSLTDQHYMLAVLLFMLSYIAIVAFSIPGATIMTLLGGFLFGAIFGTIWVVIAATIGATLTYLAVKLAFAQSWLNRSNNQTALNKMRKGFQQNEFNYLLFLRLLPIFPFFLINIGAGVLNVKWRHFVLATLLGIIPGSFIYNWVGSGLGFALSQGQQVNTGVIFSPQILLPIIALAALALFPILYKKVKQSKKIK